MPLILMDHGTFDFQGENIPIADLEGDGTSTHLGKIESIGVFESLGPGPPGRFKGKIEGTATAVPLDEMVLLLLQPPLTPLPRPRLLLLQLQIRLHIAYRPSSSLAVFRVFFTA